MFLFRMFMIVFYIKPFHKHLNLYNLCSYSDRKKNNSFACPHYLPVIFSI